MPSSIVEVSVLKTSVGSKGAAANFTVSMGEVVNKSKSTIGDLSVSTQGEQDGIMTQIHPAPDPANEQLKLQMKFNEAFLADSKESQFWSEERKRTLRNVSVRVLLATIVAGIALFALSEIWCYLFSTVDIVFRVEPPPSQQPPLQKVNVKSSFLKEVMYAESAFTCYAFGCLLGIASGFYAIFTFHARYGTRMLRFILSIVFFLIATALMIHGPLLAVIARNNATETQMLRTNEHVAFQKGVKGSMEYFKSGQCKDIDKSVTSKNETVAHEMRVFCDMLYRFMAMMYVMLGTAAIPIVAVVICFLEIIFNRKSWSTKAVKHYKNRTEEQQKADRCAVD